MGGNEAEEVAAAVVVTATMPGCRSAAGWARRPAFSGKIWARGLKIVRRMWHISDKFGKSCMFVRYMLHCSDK
jgi:hypothetical protein